MKNPAYEKNFFELMKENGKDVKTIAKHLNVKDYSMTVVDYIRRNKKGGMNHYLFTKCFDICCDYYLANRQTCNAATHPTAA